MKLLKVILFLIMTTSQIHAVEPQEKLLDKTLEERARAISKNLRCLVCRNENIDSSNAELAKDLRVLVRERLLEGDTNEGVINYIVARYGDYVLLKPKFQGSALVLWFLGPSLLILGGISFFLLNRSSIKADRQNVLREKLSARELKQLKSIIDE